MVSKITWTARSARPSTRSSRFLAGPLPEDARPDPPFRPSRPTPAAGGRWIDEPVEEGEEEPSAPAPARAGRPRGGGAAGGGDDAGDGNEGEAASGLTVENAASQDDVDSANTLATVGVAVGVIGLLVAVFALISGRRRTN